MDAAALEQMNKLRRTLGLPLLNIASDTVTPNDGPSFRDHDSNGGASDDEPASTLETREAAGYQNFQNLQSEHRRQIEREQRKKQIQKARDSAAKLIKLEGKGLGDTGNDGDLDARAWLKGQKKRQSKIEKERAEKLADELVERERLAAIEYTSADLAGVQVAHELGDFEDGSSEQILTLKDAEIGKGDDDDDSDDVLENADIAARDKLTEKLNLKKRKAYDVNDDADDRGLLAQYDEKKRKAFTLDGFGTTNEERNTKRAQIGEKLRATINLDILKPNPVSDYQEFKIKKAKKSRKKNVRQRTSDEEDDVFPAETNGKLDHMDLDNAPKPTTTTSRSVSDNLNDDEDLANALSFSRRAALKKQKRKPEDIAKELREQDDDSVKQDGPEGGMTLDDTTNFLDNLSSRPREPATEQYTIQKTLEADVDDNVPNDADQDEDATMEGYSVMENEAELLERLQREQSTHTPEVSHSGLTEEKALSDGIGAALSLLRERGLVKVVEPGDKNTLYKDRQKFIIEARIREHENEVRARMQRERDRQSGKLTGLSVKEREEHARWQNTQREHQSSLQAAATFNREYRPDVQIKYVDDDGRLMNQKEAFKHLSHQFHGKGSGKQKTEKHLKKVADEKRRLAASVLDSSQATGMNNAAGTTARKNKEAGVRLA